MKCIVRIERIADSVTHLVVAKDYEVDTTFQAFAKARDTFIEEADITDAVIRVTMEVKR